MIDQTSLHVIRYIEISAHSPTLAGQGRMTIRIIQDNHRPKILEGETDPSPKITK
jgi:hypothetical protein